MRQGFDDPDSAVRYWAALGALMRGRDGVRALAGPLQTALGDADPAVRIAAGEALGRYGSDAEAGRALEVLVQHADTNENGLFVAMAALNALDYMDERARPALEKILAVPQEDPRYDRRFRAYLPNLVGKIRADAE